MGPCKTRGWTFSKITVDVEGVWRRKRSAKKHNMILILLAFRFKKECQKIMCIITLRHLGHFLNYNPKTFRAFFKIIILGHLGHFLNHNPRTFRVFFLKKICIFYLMTWTKKDALLLLIPPAQLIILLMITIWCLIYSLNKKGGNYNKNVITRMLFSRITKWVKNILLVHCYLYTTIVFMYPYTAFAHDIK